MEAHEQALLLEMIPIFPPIRVEQVTALYIYIHTYIHLSLSLPGRPGRDPDSGGGRVLDGPLVKTPGRSRQPSHGDMVEFSIEASAHGGTPMARKIAQVPQPAVPQDAASWIKRGN